MYMYTELKHAVVSSINNYSHSPVVGSSMDSSLAKPRFNNIGLDTECSHGLRDAVTMRWLKINHWTICSLFNVFHWLTWHYTRYPHPHCENFPICSIQITAVALEESGGGGWTHPNPYYMYEKLTEEVCSEKDLGVAFSDNMNVSLHCRDSYSKVNRIIHMLGLISRTIRYRHPTVLLNLYYKSLVRPHLDYWCHLTVQIG